MSFTGMINLIDRALLEENCAFIKLYFLSKKDLRSGRTYHVYQASISESLNRQLLEHTKGCIISQTNDSAIVDYNFMGTADNTIEKIASSSISECQTILAALSDNQAIQHFTKNLDMTKIDFYCLEFSYDNKTIYFFRQFMKMKKIRKNGMIMSFFEDKLVSLEENVISIDGQIDIIIEDDALFIINHISLERIFSFKDYVINSAETMLQNIENNSIVENIAQFKADCKSDYRKSKWLARIFAHGGLTMLNEKKADIPNIVMEINRCSDANLIYINEKFVYAGKEQLTWILGMIGDDCFKKFLSGTVGISIVEATLS